MESFLRSLWFSFIGSLRQRLFSWVIGLVALLFFMCFFCCVISVILVSSGH
jgi:lipopolysaccharide/colanic/teichoic acid biosynthesis glycosyltransferase